MNPVGQIRTIAEELNLVLAAAPVLNDKRFRVWSGSSNINTHHYGTGGLAQHTLEVIELSLRNLAYFRNHDHQEQRENLFLAALYHDFGKIWDYRPVSEPIDQNTAWIGTRHKYEIHHITRSVLFWNENCLLNDERRDAVTHAILAHHMLREWGSPVQPASIIAWILSMSDNISARVDDCYSRQKH